MWNKRVAGNFSFPDIVPDIGTCFIYTDYLG